MIIVLKPSPKDSDIAEVEKAVTNLGYIPHIIKGEIRTVVAAIGDETEHETLTSLECLDCVDRVIPIQKRFKLVSREAQHEGSTVKVGKLQIGSGTFHVIAGPCSIENRDQMISTARHVARSGASLLRGGAFKPRTSPYDFQGLGEEGIRILKEAKDITGLPVVSEVVSSSDIKVMLETVDVFQIGTRNAANYNLLSAVAKSGKPALLKRGMASTVEEWLLAAEYMAKNGNSHVILCERGIRTFETATRNTLDISAVAIAKKESNLPVFVDPSHAAGRRDIILPLSKAAIAAGADGLMIEVHEHPESAHSDAAQQLSPQEFDSLMQEIEPLVKAAGKTLSLKISKEA